MRIGFDQKVRFESVSSKFESNLNPCFSYNPDVILEQCLTIFDAENRQKLHKNEYFRGKFYENCNKMTILEANFMKIAENCTKITILEADFNPVRFES